jgi:hypothetical protein
MLFLLIVPDQPEARIRESLGTALFRIPGYPWRLIRGSLCRTGFSPATDMVNDRRELVSSHQ